MTSITIFDFDHNAAIKDWQVVDDTVMGGKSSGNFKLNDAGNGVFYGHVSLENNGGFSSLQYPFEALKVLPDDVIKIHLKGDGKNYQFRVKDKN